MASSVHSSGKTILRTFHGDRRMIRVKSKTDVITNSSTEVYTYWDNDAPKIIENSLKSIVKALTGQDIKVSECFEITLRPGWWLQDVYEEFYDEGKLDHKKWPPTREATYRYYLRFIKEYADYLEDKQDEYDYPEEYWDGLEIKALDPKYKKAAEKLSDLVFGRGKLFDQNAVYC